MHRLLFIKPISNHSSSEFVSTDREELQNFNHHPSLERAVSAKPDFAQHVDEEEEDDVLSWASNDVYGQPDTSMSPIHFFFKLDT